MARCRRNYQVRTNAGAVVPNPTIEVFISGGVLHASIFSDDVGPGTPLANPFTGDANGRFFFYANDGQYDVQISGTGITTFTLGAEDFVFQAGAPGAGITSINAQVGAAQTLQTGTTGVDFTISSAANVHSFNVPTASAGARGLLAPVDFATFAGKLGNLNGLTFPTQVFAVGAAGTDFNIVSAGATHTFNIPTIGVGGASRGLLSAADYATFSGSGPALPTGTSLQYIRGDHNLATLDTSVVPENTNLYFTNARARLALSASAPLSYNNGTGVFSIPAASGAADGYLTSANWTTFNNKMGSLNGSSVVAQSFAVGTAGTDFAISTNVGTGVHTFNLPDASATNRGAVTTGAQSFAGVKTFNSHPLEVVDGRAISVDDVFYVRTSDMSVASDNTEKTVHAENWPAPLSANRVLTFLEGGTLQCSAANTITFKFYMGGTQVWTSGAINPTSASAIGFHLSLNAVIRTAGAGGVVQVNGTLLVDDAPTIIQIANVNTAAVNLTGTPELKLTMQLSNSSINDTFTVTSAVWDIRN